MHIREQNRDIFPIILGKTTPAPVIQPSHQPLSHLPQSHHADPPDDPRLGALVE